MLGYFQQIGYLFFGGIFIQLPKNSIVLKHDYHATQGDMLAYIMYFFVLLSDSVFLGNEVGNSGIVNAFLFIVQVVANAVAALSEIGDVSPTAAAMMEINSQTINKLLTALNECTE